MVIGTACLRRWVIALWDWEIRASPPLLHPAKVKNCKRTEAGVSRDSFESFPYKLKHLLLLSKADLDPNGKITDLTVFIIIVSGIILTITIPSN